MAYLTADARRVIDQAQNLAKQMRHEYYTPEHLLYVMIRVPVIQSILQRFDVDFETLRMDLEEHLREAHEPDSGSSQMNMPSNSMQRITKHTRAAAMAMGLTLGDVPHLLLSLFEERNSYAVFFLQTQSVDQQTLAKVVSEVIGADFDACVAGGNPGENMDQTNEDPSGALKTFCIDLTALAREGKITPLIGRDKEVDDLLNILKRRTKNNPLLVGDPGVGKTAIVEGLALRIVNGDVPAAFASTTVLSLDLTAMVAGTRYRGDFEERMKNVLGALKKRDDVILFIDEIHNLVGAGSASGSMDAANILKPALGRGVLHCIGATTYAEFRNHFEKDAALTRRFQKVDVSEPSASDTVGILTGIKDVFEKHHQIAYTAEAIQAAVDLSVRYLTQQKLPDKAIDLLDAAGAAAHLAGIETVDVPEIEHQVSRIGRVAPRNTTLSENEMLKDLGARLKTVVFDQDSAIDRIVNAVQVSRAGLRTEGKPVGCYLFAGPTGCGKTELARQMAKALGISLVRFDMSEYMERHSVSRLIGAPPGYVGFDQAGLLTSAVEKEPRCVLLIDEIEKAHPDVYNILLQIMDGGRLTDSNGKTIDFRNVNLIMTTNAGAAAAAKPQIGFERSLDGDQEKADTEIKNQFAPEFRNRLDAVVLFNQIGRKTMNCIVDKFIGELNQQLAERNISLEISEPAREKLAKLGFDPAFGARPLARVIDTRIKQRLAGEILFGQLTNGGKTIVDHDGQEFVFDFDASGDQMPSLEETADCLQ